MMTLSKFMRVAKVALEADVNAVIDYSDQGMILEGNFSNMSDHDRQLLKDIENVKVTNEEIEIEVI